MNNATNSETTLEGILGRVRELKDEYGKWAKATGENFNVFSILDRESDEVKTHSAIIAELLNPQGAHSQGTLFLKLFLEKLLLKEEIPNLKYGNDDLSDEYLKKFKVGVEVSFEKKDEKGEMKRSQIDILIESNDVCIVIENKIYAEDQERQLGRYYEYALDTGKNLGIIYLTLLGDEPGEFTLYGGEGEPRKFYGKNKIPPCRMLPEDTVVCLSYEDFIVKWVDDCIKEVAHIPQIRETLHQYQILLKELTGQPINRRYAVALKDILLEDKNYNLIPELDTAISEAKVAFQCDFWTKLKEKIKAQKELKDTRYEVYKGNLKIEEKAGPKECIDECASQGGLGLTPSFSEKGNYEIMFRIAHERYPLYYGFVLCEKGGRKKVAIDETEQEHKEYLKRYSIADGKADGQSGWLTYKSFNHKINFTNFKFVTEHTEPNREALIERLVGVLVEEICGVIEKISERERSAAT